MNRTGREWLGALQSENCDTLEISGTAWKDFGFKTYRSVDYPGYDICEGPLEAKFDLIIAEQVFEHLRWPYRAGRNVFAMLKPNGHFYITTPFVYRIHEAPIDCSRWTETGMRYLMCECGFSEEHIRTGSWGNRACARAFMDGYIEYNPLLHSLANEPDMPVVVWALCQKQPGQQ